MSPLGSSVVAMCIAASMLAGVPAWLQGQTVPSAPNVDSLTAVLDAPDLTARSMAVAALSGASPAAIPGATRAKLIGLLEREATSPRSPVAGNGEDSEWGLYVTQLVRLVLRFQDRSSARGLALIGITTSADAQRFVASLGEAAMPLLDEAERSDTAIADAVAATRGRMIGDYASALSPASRMIVRREVLDIAQRNPLAFARAARFGRMVESVPLLSSMAATASSDLRRAVLGKAAQQLTAARTQASTEDIAASLAASLAALCDNAAGSRFGACEELGSLLRQGSDDLRASRPEVARQHFTALAKAADDAASRGAITAAEGTMIAGTATYLTSRI